MIQDTPISEQPVGKIIGREIAASVASLLLLPLGIRKSRKRTPRQKEQRTVVFVHGYLNNRAVFLPLYTYLRAFGVKQTLAFNYRPGAGVESAAIQLRQFLRRHVRGGRIDLICHSLGGVIARVYIQELGGHRRVDRCITLGTPHRGTYNSYWVPSAVGRDLRPDSALLKRLVGSRKKSEPVKFTSIVGGSDNIIIPRVFSADGEDVMHVPDVGHLGLLFSPSVFRAIAKRLGR